METSDGVAAGGKGQVGVRPMMADVSFSHVTLATRVYIKCCQ